MSSTSRLLTALLFVAILSDGCATTVRFTPARGDGFIARETVGHPHYIYVPSDWSEAEVEGGKRWPVILYLHGGGERGADGVLPTQEGLGPVVQRSRGAFPFIVAFPQTAAGSVWPLPDMEQRAMGVLDEVLAEYGGDPRRVYLTGHSLGGFGTWILGARHPDRFAALVPISGGIAPPEDMALPPEAQRPVRGGTFADAEARSIAALRHTPVWAFVGELDMLVPPRLSRRIVDRLQSIGAPARYTEFADVGHRADNHAYIRKDLFEWLARQRLRAPPDDKVNAP